MKNFLLWILMIVLVLWVAGNRTEGSKKVYPSGRDTIESYGDGTYQMIRVGGREGLGSAKYHTGIIDQVNQIKQTTDKVYIIGSEVQGYIADGEPVECGYTIYIVISLCDNRMQFFAVSEDPSAPDFYIRWLDEMIENNEAQRLDKFTDFSDADQMEFNELLRSDNDG